MQRKALVLDANILIRAVLGQRVRRIFEVHAESISFFLPETAYAEAEEHLVALVEKRGGDPAKALAALKAMAALALRNRSAEASRHTRSGGLADSGSGPCSRLSDLDGRHRFLRMWCRHLDFWQHRHFSLAVAPSHLVSRSFGRRRFNATIVYFGCWIGTFDESRDSRVPRSIVAPLAADLDRATLRLTA
jgi:hypothetical protein